MVKKHNTGEVAEKQQNERKKAGNSNIQLEKRIEKEVIMGKRIEYPYRKVSKE